MYFDVVTKFDLSKGPFLSSSDINCILLSARLIYAGNDFTLRSPHSCSGSSPGSRSLPLSGEILNCPHVETESIGTTNCFLGLLGLEKKPPPDFCSVCDSRRSSMPLT